LPLPKPNRRKVASITGYLVLLFVGGILGLVLVLFGILTVLEGVLLSGGFFSILFVAVVLPRESRRNKAAYALALFTLILFIFSLPISPFQPFSLFAVPESSTNILYVTHPAYAINVTNPSQHENITLDIANGTLTLFSKSGLSAGSPIEMTVVLYINESTVYKLLSVGTFPDIPSIGHPAPISFAPTGAYAYPIQLSPAGFPKFSNFSLTNTGGNNVTQRYEGSGWVEYIQSGIWGFKANIFGDKLTGAPLFTIDSADVTASSITSNLTTSLTLAIILLAVVELRSKD
jgi:hypothetical protein